MGEASRDGLRLLPSKKYPRVKRWQANKRQASLGKAAATLLDDDVEQSESYRLQTTPPFCKFLRSKPPTRLEISSLGLPALTSATPSINMAAT